MVAQDVSPGCAKRPRFLSPSCAAPAGRKKLLRGRRPLCRPCRLTAVQSFRFQVQSSKCKACPPRLWRVPSAARMPKSTVGRRDPDLTVGARSALPQPSFCRPVPRSRFPVPAVTLYTTPMHYTMLQKSIIQSRLSRPGIGCEKNNVRKCFRNPSRHIYDHSAKKAKKA